MSDPIPSIVLNNNGFGIELSTESGSAATNASDIAWLSRRDLVRRACDALGDESRFDDRDYEDASFLDRRRDLDACGRVAAADEMNSDETPVAAAEKRQCGPSPPENIQVSARDLEQIAGQPTPYLPQIANSVNEYAKLYGLTTPQRMAHFLSQVAHESDNFRTLEEYASGRAYEGRSSLGNVRSGDGQRYKGRGIIQLTGRANYVTYGNALGVDLELEPEQATTYSGAIALEYWRRTTRNGVSMNELADRDDIVSITRRVNGGLNGLEDRQQKLETAKMVFCILPWSSGYEKRALGGANLFAAPSMDAAVVLLLPQGTPLRPARHNPAPVGWLAVTAKVGDRLYTGYVRSEHVEATQ